MMTIRGRNATMAARKIAHSPDLFPALIPARCPAGLMSWQGNPPHRM